MKLARDSSMTVPYMVASLALLLAPKPTCRAVPTVKIKDSIAFLISS
jgi:hypothetical protein